MSYPAWGTSPIKCGNRKCTWTGKETDLKDIPHKTLKNCTKQVCPKCGCDSYTFVQEAGKDDRFDITHGGAAA